MGNEQTISKDSPYKRKEVFEGEGMGQHPRCRKNKKERNRKKNKIAAKSRKKNR